MKKGNPLKTVLNEKFLEVKKSNLPGCGKGLFTKTDIEKDQVIVEYKGEKITWAEALNRNQQHKKMSPYIFYISDKNCVDAEYTTDALARYANDANGYTKVKGYRNNCSYEVIKQKPYIVATRRIKAGQEIFVRYGKDYWDAMGPYFAGLEEKKKLKSKK